MVRARQPRGRRLLVPSAVVAIPPDGGGHPRGGAASSQWQEATSARQTALLRQLQHRSAGPDAASSGTPRGIVDEPAREVRAGRAGEAFVAGHNHQGRELPLDGCGQLAGRLVQNDVVRPQTKGLFEQASSVVLFNLHRPGLFNVPLDSDPSALVLATRFQPLPTVPSCVGL